MIVQVVALVVTTSQLKLNRKIKRKTIIMRMMKKTISLKQMISLNKSNSIKSQDTYNKLKGIDSRHAISISIIWLQVILILKIIQQSQWMWKILMEKMKRNPKLLTLINKSLSLNKSEKLDMALLLLICLKNMFNKQE